MCEEKFKGSKMLKFLKDVQERIGQPAIEFGLFSGGTIRIKLHILRDQKNLPKIFESLKFYSKVNMCCDYVF